MMDKRLKNFKNFLYLCWKHLTLPDPTPIQFDIADYLQSDEKRLVIEAFRGVGKSWITSAFVCHQLLLNPQKNIFYVLSELYTKSYQTLLVEGGGETISSFLDSDLFDELHIYYAPKMIGNGKPLYTGYNTLIKDYKLLLQKVDHFDNDIKMTFHRGV